MEHDKGFGLHKLLTLETFNQTLLTDLTGFINFSDKLIYQYEMEKVGLSSHLFETGGFTVAICLKESHICVHTWPEINSLTLDVYLCNYSCNNESKVQNVSMDYIAYFEGKIITEHNIFR